MAPSCCIRSNAALMSRAVTLIFPLAFNISEWLMVRRCRLVLLLITSTITLLIIGRRPIGQQLAGLDLCCLFVDRTYLSNFSHCQIDAIATVALEQLGERRG